MLRIADSQSGLVHTVRATSICRSAHSAYGIRHKLRHAPVRGLLTPGPTCPIGIGHLTVQATQKAIASDADTCETRFVESRNNPFRAKQCFSCADQWCAVEVEILSVPRHVRRRNTGDATAPHQACIPSLQRRGCNRRSHTHCTFRASEMGGSAGRSRRAGAVVGVSVAIHQGRRGLHIRA